MYLWIVKCPCGYHFKISEVHDTAYCCMKREQYVITSFLVCDGSGVWLPHTLSHWKLNGNDAANNHKGNHFTLAEDIRHKMNKCNNQCKHNGHLIRRWGCRRVLHNYTTHPYICGQYSNRPPVQSYRSISLTSRPRIPHSWWSWAGEGGACCHAWVQCNGLTYGNSYGSIILSTTVSD